MSGPRAGPLVIDAPAKVNLVLRVLGRQPSGYHDIETLFQAVGLCDRLLVEVVPGRGATLEVEGLDAGPPEDNLVLRAARAYLDAADPGFGVHVRLEKRIPAGAGLGGGSSDAAATLRALDVLAGGALAADRLHALAADLGSDVAFFLGASPLAEGRGRGERLTPVLPLPEAGIVLGLPAAYVSTAEAYRALARARARTGGALPPRVLAPRPPNAWSEVVRRALNDFEAVVPARYPEIRRALDALRADDPPLAMLSGSGAAVFALFADAARAEAGAAAAARRDPATRYVAVPTITAWPEPRAT